MPNLYHLQGVTVSMIISNQDVFKNMPFLLVDKMIQAEELCESLSDKIASKAMGCFQYDDPCLVIDKSGEIYLFERNDVIDDNCIDGIHSIINNAAMEMIKHRKQKDGKDVIPVFVYLDSAIPQIVAILKPEQHIQKRKRTGNVIKESDVENNLVVWLKSHGIACESQAVIKNGRTDIWIPGVCFIELKTGTITAKDVCQVINYYCETKRKVLLVGKAISKDVVLTIEHINEITGNESIVFVSWSAIYVYLRGLLGIN